MQYICLQISIACDYSNTKFLLSLMKRYTNVDIYRPTILLYSCLFILSTNIYYISTRSKALFSNWKYSSEPKMIKSRST